MVKKAHSAPQGQIRIIAGLWRGRKLPVLTHDGLRPTTDRVRETLFNWLMPVINGARCLDAFAGSGALGFEALSRHAAAVTFIELNRAVATQISANARLLTCDHATVVNQSAPQFLAQPGTPFDVVFLDPPFRKGLLQETVDLLEQNGWLSANAMIYAEAEAESDPLIVPANWLCHREKVAGQVAYRLYLRQATAEQAN
ncbi:16S rRNA (guanine(966)-N(2))-methyltransferase [Morganella psychrotolerans]|uniref:Ribosomal RNA small subunit methyltransferase D n=1 Tax=Morganella psychrotolerans TaxID=368603 RepID=A0A5M9R7Z7_9GAMM|nr:16S rRNA (guanine(966)-N(2))-methyltransferase [Morganella psychrotolerans]KAA8715555.1 16S rRNA (guanine(966)-N(2))-methyltransferase [Morganella psychrotolerans]